MKSFASKVFIIFFFAAIAFRCKEEDLRSSEKRIIDFKILNSSGDILATIDEAKGVIRVVVPHTVNINELSPVIDVSPEASVVPGSGVLVDLSKPVTYTVTAENGTAARYTAVATVLRNDENRILSLKLTDPLEIIGEISEAQKEIFLLVPNALDLKQLVPVLEVSEKASVEPAPGIPVDFTKPVYYRVTADNGIAARYRVYAMLQFGTTYSVEPHAGFLEYQRGANFLIKGDNFGVDPDRVKIIWTNRADQSKTIISSFVILTSRSIGFLIPESMPFGEYNVDVFINYEQRVLDEVFKIVVALPKVTAINKTTVERGHKLVITGTDFQETGNLVKLTRGFLRYTLPVDFESTTKIEAWVPLNVSAYTYRLGLVAHNVERTVAEIQVTAPGGIPEITHVEKSEYARGDTLILRGLGLARQGFSTNIHFVPAYNNGATLVRGVFADPDGTEVKYVIPSNFPKTSYQIQVEVSEAYSNLYHTLITVQ